MLLAHSEAAWGLSLASFELGGSLGIDFNGRRSLVSGSILYHLGHFWFVHYCLSVHGQMQSLSYKAYSVFFAW